MECWSVGVQGSEIAPRRAGSTQRFAKDIFTTKRTKDTKDSENYLYFDFLTSCSLRRYSRHASRPSW